LIAYASVYGHTENTAEILACTLRDRGVKTEVFDVSVTDVSEIVAAAFRWSHLVLASTTYNAGIFIMMEAFIADLTAHNIQNRDVAIIENGSWAATSGGLIRARLEKCKSIRFLDASISIKSALKESQRGEIEAMADAIVASFPASDAATAGSPPTAATAVDRATMFTLSYGLFVLTARDGAKDNGCIVNTVTQITEKPLRISVAVNQANFTHDMIKKTGAFNVSVLTEIAPFRVFQQFGFSSGRETDKFAGCGYDQRAANGVRYVPENVNVVISAKVIQALDYGTHTVFIADVTEAFKVSQEPSTTYQYYFDHIKPKPQALGEKKKGFVCKICGYVHEGDDLPADFICPLCKHGATDFERL